MYSDEIMVMPSDTGCLGEIKVKRLLDHFQDTAARAVDSLEGSTGELMRRGYAWVLLKYQLNIDKRLPALDETFKLTTWHMTKDGFHTLRAFDAASGRGFTEHLLSARTSWILIDLAAQKPVRAARCLPEIFLQREPQPAIDDNFPKIREPEAPAKTVLFPVRFHDLDANVHVNNAVYFEWVYEATPLDLMDYRLNEVSAEFRVSVKFGETVAVDVREEAAGPVNGQRAFVYTLHVASETGAQVKPLARFRALWSRGV